MAGTKRSADESALVVAKRGRGLDDSDVSSSKALTVLPQLQRTSTLEAPTMLLTGHGGAVYAVDFSPDGASLASCSHDREIFLWRTSGNCKNYCVLGGHTSAVLDVRYVGDGLQLASCSADKSCGLWDLERGERVRRFREHTEIVNSIAVSKSSAATLASASDDSCVKLWDLRAKASSATVLSTAPVVSVALSADAGTVFYGDAHGVITAYDVRGGAVAYKLAKHSEPVTGLALSHSGTHLVSNGMDGVVLIFDVRPFAPPERCVAELAGATHNFEASVIRTAWSPDDQRVGSGSADACVYVWDALTKRTLYKLPGHSGTVLAVAFHPREPVIASCGSDGKVYLGEISPS